jgi:hypothetical protein
MFSSHQQPRRQQCQRSLQPSQLALLPVAHARTSQLVVPSSLAQLGQPLPPAHLRLHAAAQATVACGARRAQPLGLPLRPYQTRVHSQLSSRPRARRQKSSAHLACSVMIGVACRCGLSADTAECWHLHHDKVCFLGFRCEDSPRWSHCWLTTLLMQAYPPRRRNFQRCQRCLTRGALCTHCQRRHR